MIRVEINVRLFCMVLAFMTAPSAIAQHDWATGRAFSVARQQIVGISWSQSPLRESLENFARRQRIPIFLDRRIDPMQPVDFVSSQNTFDQTLMDLADELGLGAVRVAESYYYLGPRESVAELEFRRKELFDAINALPRDKKQKWLAKEPLIIEFLDEPATVYRDLDQRSDAKLSFGQTLPYDLWPHIDLPPLSLLDRMIVLCYGFELWIDVSKDSSAARLLPMEPFPSFELRHAKRLTEEHRSLLLETHPTAEVTYDETSNRITAPAIVHYDIRRLLDSTRPRTRHRNTADAQTVVDFTTGDRDAAIGAILKNVARMKQVEFRFDSELEPILHQRIRLHLQKVTYEQLLKATLESTDLKFQLTESELFITR